jgi:hypothetical protein
LYSPGRNELLVVDAVTRTLGRHHIDDEPVVLGSSVVEGDRGRSEHTGEGEEGDEDVVKTLSGTIKSLKGGRQEEPRRVTEGRRCDYFWMPASSTRPGAGAGERATRMKTKYRQYKQKQNKKRNETEERGMRPVHASETPRDLEREREMFNQKRVFLFRTIKRRRHHHAQF